MQLATVLLLAALGSVTWGERSDAKTRVGGIDLAAAARVWGDGLQAPERTSENFAATTNSRRDVYSLGFTGHQYDPETRLVYARARYYDPDLGRFVSRDSYEGSIGDAPSLHRYTYVRGNPLRFTDPDGHCAVNKDGTLNCLQPAMTMQRQITAAMNQAWSEGDYGQAALAFLLGTANTVNVGVGAAAQLVVGAPYNAGYDASAGFRTGDYDRALRGSTELLMIAGAEKAFKAAQWVEETAAPAVKKVVTEAAETVTTKLAPEVAAAERSAVTEAVEQATKPGTAQVASAEVGTPRFRSVGAAAADDPALAAAASAKPGAGAVGQQATPPPFEGVRELSRTLRDAGVPREARLDVIRSFTDGSISRRVATGSENVLRYYGGEANQAGRFVTPAFPQGDARTVLALPPENLASELTQFRLREGATYFQGTVARNFNLPGGGEQYFVPSLEDLLLVGGP